MILLERVKERDVDPEAEAAFDITKCVESVMLEITVFAGMFVPVTERPATSPVVSPTTVVEELVVVQLTALGKLKAIDPKS